MTDSEKIRKLVCEVHNLPLTILNDVGDIVFSSLPTTEVLLESSFAKNNIRYSAQSNANVIFVSDINISISSIISKTDGYIYLIGFVALGYFLERVANKSLLMRNVEDSNLKGGLVFLNNCQ